EARTARSHITATGAVEIGADPERIERTVRERELEPDWPIRDRRYVRSARPGDARARAVPANRHTRRLCIRGDGVAIRVEHLHPQFPSGRLDVHEEMLAAETDRTRDQRAG